MKKVKILTTAIFAMVMIFSSCEKEQDSTPSPITQTNKIKTKNNKVNGATYSTELISCTKRIGQGPTLPGTACFKRTSYDPCTGDHSCTTNTAMAAQIQAHFSQTEIENWGDGTAFSGDGIESLNEHYDFYVYLFEEGILAEHPDDIIANYNANNE